MLRATYSFASLSTCFNESSVVVATAYRRKHRKQHTSIVGAYPVVTGWYSERCIGLAKRTVWRYTNWSCYGRFPHIVYDAESIHRYCILMPISKKYDCTIFNNSNPRQYQQWHWSQIHWDNRHQQSFLPKVHYSVFVLSAAFPYGNPQPFMNLVAVKVEG